MTVKELISVLSLIHDQSKEVVLWPDEEEIAAIRVLANKAISTLQG